VLRGGAGKCGGWTRRKPGPGTWPKPRRVRVQGGWGACFGVWETVGTGAEVLALATLVRAHYGLLEFRRLHLGRNQLQPHSSVTTPSTTLHLHDFQPNFHQ
jgi:hypothetical protein